MRFFETQLTSVVLEMATSMWRKKKLKKNGNLDLNSYIIFSAIFAGS